MRIAVCDDEPVLLKKISKLLDEYKLPNGAEFKYDVFTNAFDLLHSMKSVRYDVLILDIIMPGFTGMDAAHEIRELNDSVSIVFLTSSPEFAVESYTVHASDYLLKPVSREALYPCLNRLSLTVKEEENKISLTTAKKIVSLSYDSIKYITVHSHTLEFHTIDGSVHEVNGRLVDYLDRLLSQEGFYQTHRSYVTNFKYVRTIEGNDVITIKGDIIPISRNCKNEVKTAFFEYISRNS